MPRNMAMIDNLNKLNGMRKSNSNIILFLILIIFTLLKPYTLGVFFDEGTYIYRSWRLLEGDILYRDIGEIRPAGHYFFFILPFMFILKMFGLSPVSTLVGLRIVLSIWESLAFYFIYLILIDIIKLDKRLSLILIASIVISPLVIGWTTYVITENIFLLPFFAGLYYYFKNRYSLAGILLGVSLLIRHTVFLLLVPILVDITILKKNIKSFKYFLIGLVLPFSVILLYLLTTKSFTDFIYYTLQGLSYSKGWFTPPSLRFKYEHYLEQPVKLDPAIVFLLILGVFSFFSFHKLRGRLNHFVIITSLYMFGVLYWLFMFIFASYNTKYILPVAYLSILSVGVFINNIRINIKKIFVAMTILLTILQFSFIFSTDYLKDPVRNDNFVSPFLSEQVLMGETVKKYNISDKEWFISHQVITSYFAQIDCYNHLNIKSDYAFPPREKLIPILSKIKLVMLDPATKFHMRTKAWVNDSNMDLYLSLTFRITDMESSVNDGFDIYMRSEDKKIIIVRYHTNPDFDEKVEFRKNDIVIHRVVKQNVWNTEKIPISKLFTRYYNCSPTKIYISLVVNADRSTLSVDIDKIEAFDDVTGLVLYSEDFEPIGNTLKMSISKGYFKYRIGNIGNGALTYIQLNYLEVGKIPIHKHQNINKIVCTSLFLNKNYSLEIHKQHILKRIAIKHGD